MAAPPLRREKKVEMHFCSLHFLLGGSRQFPTQQLGLLKGPLLHLNLTMPCLRA